MSGCDVVTPIRKYTNTQKMVRRCFFSSLFFCVSVLRKRHFCCVDTRIHIAKWPHRFAYSFFSNKPSTWNFYLAPFGTCPNTKTPKNSQNVAVCRQFGSPRGTTPPLPFCLGHKHHLMFLGLSSNLFVIVFFVFACQMSTFYWVYVGIKKSLLIL